MFWVLGPEAQHQKLLQVPKYKHVRIAITVLVEVLQIQVRASIAVLSQSYELPPDDTGPK